MNTYKVSYRREDGTKGARKVKASNEAAARTKAEKKINGTITGVTFLEPVIEGGEVPQEKAPTKKDLKKAQKERIRALIQKALPLEFELVWIPRIIKFQTPQEKEYKDAIDKNGEGLTKADAYVVTKLAKRIGKGGHISVEEADDLRVRLPKYWQQYTAQMTSQGEN